MQPNERRGYGWELLRVRQDGGVASQPGWHVRLRDDGDACGEREPLRGQPRVRRVYGRLRGRLPAALRAAATTIPTSVAAAAIAATSSNVADVRVQRDARGRWQRHQRHNHLC